MRRFVMPIPDREEIRRGIAYMVAAVLVFALINVAVKWLVARYPVTQVVFFRCLFALIPCAVLVAIHGGIGGLRTRRLGGHLGRAVSQFLGMMMIFTAFGMMPLADAIAISFSTPLFITLLSIPLLGERVGLHRWSAVLVGFVGVLVMVKPGAGVLELGALLALGNAALVASSTIGVRRMSVTESSTTLFFYQIAITTLFSALLLPLGWTTPSLVDAAMMAAVGLCSGLGQFYWIQAFRFAPAAVAAPFTYTSMVWAVLFGYLIWAELPTFELLIGAAIVVASGLYILYRETIRRAEARVAPAVVPGDD